MEPWEHVVQIPEGRVGTYAIEHFTKPAGEVARSNIRTAFIGGQADPPLVFDRPTQWHRLTYEGGVWMTDLPIEQVQHDQELEPVTHGNVLVGGLGVGYAANVLAARTDVERVVVVEISPEVVSLVGPHVKDPDGKIEIVNANLFDYVRDCEGGFDFGFYDIWQSDGENTFHNTVVPLRNLSVGKVDEVICWNENIMRGQLYQGLQSRLLFTRIPAPPGSNEIANMDGLAREVGNVFHDWAVPFWEAVLEGVVPSFDDQGNITKEFVRRAGEYAGTYGHPGWKSWWRAVRRGLA